MVIEIQFVCRSAGSCTAAAFLRKFVSVPSWAHLDIAGVMESKGEILYLQKGMSGEGICIEQLVCSIGAGWLLSIVDALWIRSFVRGSNAPIRWALIGA